MDRAPAGFLSYARLDDEYEEGYITHLRERLEKEVRLFTGDDFAIFQDRVDVRWGEEWAVRIGQALHSVTFLFPVLTPSFFKSVHCLQELQDFFDLEKKADRRDLVLPIYYLESLVLEKTERREAHPLAFALSTRQYVDWRDLRGTSFRDPRTRTRLATMARQVRDALDKTPPVPTYREQEQAPEISMRVAKPIKRPEIELPAQEDSGGPISYEDFILGISRTSDGDYVLRVLRSPAGEGEARIAEEYAMQEIEEVGQAIAKVNRQGSNQEIVGLGKRVHRLLMPPLIDTIFSSSLAYLGPRHGLRLALRLGLEDPTVAPFWSLPWEYIHRPEDDYFLGLTRRCLVVRLLDLPIPSLPPVQVAPIRLLVVAVNQPALAILDLDREISNIKQAFASVEFEIQVLKDGTLAGMREALLSSDFHGIHFSGHGHFDEGRGEGALLFNDRGGQIQSVSGHTFADNLRGFPNLRFAMLNASFSGKVASVNPLGGVAASLLRSGLSAVVAFQSQVADAESIAFSKSLYQRLAAGNSVDVAVGEGRLAIARLDPNGIGWGSPVLYTRVPDGRLFQGRENVLHKGV